MQRPLSVILHSPRFTLMKWAAMAAAVFWTLIYQVSQQGASLPEFVYVNF